MKGMLCAHLSQVSCNSGVEEILILYGMELHVLWNQTRIGMPGIILLACQASRPQESDSLELAC